MIFLIFCLLTYDVTSQAVRAGGGLDSRRSLRALPPVPTRAVVMDLKAIL